MTSKAALARNYRESLAALKEKAARDLRVQRRAYEEELGIARKTVPIPALPNEWRVYFSPHEHYSRAITVMIPFVNTIRTLHWPPRTFMFKEPVSIKGWLAFLLVWNGKCYILKALRFLRRGFPTSEGLHLPHSDGIVCLGSITNAVLGRNLLWEGVKDGLSSHVRDIEKVLSGVNFASLYNMDNTWERGLAWLFKVASRIYEEERCSSFSKKLFKSLDMGKYLISKSCILEAPKT